MNAFDLAPLFRSGVGFDRLARLAETASRLAEPNNSYPPYNIEHLGPTEDGGDAYSITVAVAGFAPEDITVEAESGLLTVSGHKAQDTRQESARLLHRGIALRDFVRRFQLADTVTVTGATLRDGLLTVALKREVPEQAKPRRIDITTGRPAAPMVPQIGSDQPVATDPSLPHAA